MEAVVDVWKECQPQGFTVAEQYLPWLVPVVAGRLLRSAPRCKELGDLFKQPNGCPCTFQQLLQVEDGLVHFLYFWKAFDESAIVADLYPTAGITAELRTLRDDILRHLEDEIRAADVNGLVAFDGMLVDTLEKEVGRAAAMSARPLFWRSAAEQLSRMDADILSVQELTAVMLDWLREAQEWQDIGIGGVEHGNSSSSIQSALPQGNSTQPVSFASMLSSATSWAWSGQQEEMNGISVRLNIYDVAKDASIKTLNTILAHESAPVRFGGVFHAGVEVNGLEWSFGFSNSCSKPGVSCIQPRSNKQHSYRETIECGCTQTAPDEIGQIISGLLEEYPGHDYDLLRRNCCHFAEEFCRRLGVDGIPNWLHRLARLGAGVETVVRAAYSVKEHFVGADRSHVMAPPAVRHRRLRKKAAKNGLPHESQSVSPFTLLPTESHKVSHADPHRLPSTVLRSSARIAAAEAIERTAERSPHIPEVLAEGGLEWPRSLGRDWGLTAAI